MAGAKAISGSISAAQRTALLMPVVLAVLVGTFLAFGTGFAPLAAVHNAAHDARHGFAFPCH